eukprot:scaffold100113_cov20-Tisochrysis_lutea.AAC.1
MGWSDGRPKLCTLLAPRGLQLICMSNTAICRPDAHGRLCISWHMHAEGQQTVCRGACLGHLLVAGCTQLLYTDRKGFSEGCTQRATPRQAHAYVGSESQATPWLAVSHFDWRPTFPHWGLTGCHLAYPPSRSLPNPSAQSASNIRKEGLQDWHTSALIQELLLGVIDRTTDIGSPRTLYWPALLHLLQLQALHKVCKQVVATREVYASVHGCLN